MNLKDNCDDDYLYSSFSVFLEMKNKETFHLFFGKKENVKFILTQFQAKTILMNLTK